MVLRTTTPLFRSFLFFFFFPFLGAGDKGQAPRSLVICARIQVVHGELGPRDEGARDRLQLLFTPFPLRLRAPGKRKGVNRSLFAFDLVM